MKNLKEKKKYKYGAFVDWKAYYWIYDIPTLNMKLIYEETVMIEKEEDEER